MSYLLEYGHLTIEKGPGSLWVPGPTAHIVRLAHTVTPRELFSDLHYHVVVRYAYAVASLYSPESEDFFFWRGMYENMQIKRAGSCRIEEFDLLIQSFKARGSYDPKYPIPVDRQYNILDGAHRLACAAALDYTVPVVIYDTPSHAYEREWFVGNGFSEYELSRVDEVRDIYLANNSPMNSQMYTIVIWGAALQFWDRIIGAFDQSKLIRSFIFDLGDSFREFTMDSYEGDGMNFDRISGKAEALGMISTRVGIIQIRDNFERLIVIKKDVRAQLSPLISNYFFDNILHLIDYPEVGIRLLAKYGIHK